MIVSNALLRHVIIIPEIMQKIETNRMNYLVNTKIPNNEMTDLLRPIIIVTSIDLTIVPKSYHDSKLQTMTPIFATTTTNKAPRMPMRIRSFVFDTLIDAIETSSTYFMKLSIASSSSSSSLLSPQKPRKNYLIIMTDTFLSYKLANIIPHIRHTNIHRCFFLHILLSKMV